MKRALASTGAIVALAVLAFAPAAGAATEFGSNCAGTDEEGGLTFVDVSHSGSEPLPVTAPVGGVITRAKSNIGIPIPGGGFTATLEVFRGGGPSQFTLVGQSSAFPLNSGANTFPTRVPVQAGDHLGLLGGGLGTFFCETGDPADVMAYTNEQTGIGGTANFDQAVGYRAPLAAVIEPDADNDGYGDETQDGCPQSAAFQTACPLILVDTSSLVGGRGVTVYVATSSAGPVAVKGVARLGKGRKATLKAGPKTVPAGKIVAFKLKFSAKLIKRLKELEPSQKLTLKVTASATNVAGQVSTDKLKVKLKGQG